MHKSVLSLFLTMSLAAPVAFAQLANEAAVPADVMSEAAARAGGGGSAPARSAPAPQSRPAPVQRQAPAPVQRQTPVQQSRPAPVQRQAPAPVQRQAPVQQPRPAPVQQPRPAPVERQPRPAPVERQAPAQRPTQPAPQTRQTPTQPNRTEPSRQTPTQPNRNEPNKPVATQPNRTEPSRTNPTQPNRNEPNKPVATQPNRTEPSRPQPGQERGPAQKPEPTKPGNTTENRPGQPQKGQPEKGQPGKGQPGKVDPVQPVDRSTAKNNRPTPGVSASAERTRTAKIEVPQAPTGQLKGAPKVNADKSVTSHYQDGSSIRKSADGKVISEYNAKDHKTVYSNKDGSTTVAQGSRSVRTFQNGDKVVRNASAHEVSTFNAAKNQTIVRAPGRQITIDHNTNIVNVRQGRESYQQIPRNGGYVRNVTINNINIVRNYNYGYNRFGGYGSFYSPGIYASPYYSAFVGGFYGGFGYLANAGYYVNPWGYGWSVWNRYPAQVCWWGGCNYVGYGYAPFTPVYTWRADYGYYYTPVVSIVNPVDYLLGTLIAESLEDRRQARLDAEAMARQDALDQQQAIADAAAQDEEQAEVLRQQAADELQAAQDEKARNASCIQDKNEPMSQEAIDAQKTTVNHVTTEIAQKTGDIDVVDFLTSDKGVHGFQIHDTLTVGVDGTDNQCNLDEGDVVEVNPGFAVTKDTENVLVKVLSAVPGDCRPGKVVNVGVEKLQDMLNATVEKVNDAMNDMATKKMGQQK